MLLGGEEEDDDFADFNDDDSDTERTSRPVGSGWSVITSANPPSPRSLHAATVLVRAKKEHT
jgi:hypothetical protein